MKQSFFIIIIIIIITTIFFIGMNYEKKKNIAVKKLPVYLEEVNFNQNDSTVLYWINYFKIKHPEIVQKQAILETGHYMSKLCTEHNNLFGLYDNKNNKYYEFDTWIESIIAYKWWIQDRYQYDEKEDYYDFLKRIGYAEDDKYIEKLKEF